MAGSTHTHKRHDKKSLAGAASEVLIGANEQWTPMRAKVFDILADFTKPASAYEIADEMSRREGRRIAPNSIYRILDLFVEHNLAARVESRNAYLANDHPGCFHDCIFLVCDDCGVTTHVDDDKMTRTVRKAAERDGFTVERPVIELRGRCKDCS